MQHRFDHPDCKVSSQGGLTRSELINAGTSSFVDYGPFADGLQDMTC